MNKKIYDYSWNMIKELLCQILFYLKKNKLIKYVLQNLYNNV